MKKIISILLAAAMVLAFAACGNNSGNNGGNDAAVTDPLEVLSKTWSSLPEEDKFPAAGGDNGSPVDDKPGKFDISDTDNLDYMLSFPAGSVDLIDSAASLTHMMNMNTFTCGAYHVKMPPMPRPWPSPCVTASSPASGCAASPIRSSFSP